MQIKITDNFNLHRIAASGQCFRAAEIQEPGTDAPLYRFVHGKHVLYMKQIAPNTYEVSCTRHQWDTIWAVYFDLDRNYAKLNQDIPSDDTFMLEAAKGALGIRILRQDPWETLISFIISQRKSIPAIKTSVERLSSLFCMRVTPKISKTAKLNIPEESVYAFPTPSQLCSATTQELKTCGLGYRLPYIQNAAKLVANKDVDLASFFGLQTEDLMEALKDFRGVGDKVANCVALFAYGRTECAPVDTWINKVIHLYYNGKNPFPGYGQNAGIYQQYAFYAMTGK